MTSFRQDCGSNKSAGNRRITKLKAFVVLNSEDFHEFDLGANVTREGFDLNLVANSNSVPPVLIIAYMYIPLTLQCSLRSAEAFLFAQIT